MKQIVTALSLILVLGLSLGCAKKQRYHETDLPDPQSFQAHFHEIDSDANGMVTRQEFNDYFPDADQKVFTALDLNGDQVVDRDEWNKFRQAHGAEHKKHRPERHGLDYY